MGDTNILNEVTDVSAAKRGGDPDSSDDCGCGGVLKTLFIGSLVVLAVILVYCIVIERRVGNRLAKKGWVLYTRGGCHFCTQQLAFLGGTYPKLVECDSGQVVDAGNDVPDALVSCASITRYPFWRNAETGQTRVGLQNVHQLRDMLETSAN